jgi:tubulin polyglutamylase TTLL9
MRLWLKETAIIAVVASNILFLNFQSEDENDWDFVWADREWVYSVYGKSIYDVATYDTCIILYATAFLIITTDKMQFNQWQRMNHFRNGRELCRKDLMAKNMKRRRRALEKEGRQEEAAAYEFIPATFVLPREYSMFVEEFKKTG